MYYHGSNFTTCRLDGERKAEPGGDPPPMIQAAASYARTQPQPGLLDLVDADTDPSRLLEPRRISPFP
jgi:hypothetical protein